MERYNDNDQPPPELRLEIYLGRGKYPYNHDVPTFALLGGGIPQGYLHKLTQQLYEEASTRAIEEEPGDPQLFTIITHVGEIWESIVEEEGVETQKAIEEARKVKMEEIRKQKQTELEAAAASGDSAAVVESESNAIKQGKKFTSEQERREYANRVAKGMAVASSASGNSTTGDSKAAGGKKSKKYYNTGVSDQSLIDDLFS